MKKKGIGFPLGEGVAESDGEEEQKKFMS